MPALGLSALTLCIRRRPSGAPPPALATLQVQWTDESAIEDAFRVRWVPTAGGTTLQADTAANVETYTIAGLQWNTQYDVEITAVNGVGESDVLGPIALYTPPPTAPTLCTATATGATTATIGWTLPGTEPVTGYRVYRSPAGAGTWTAVGTVAAGVNTYAATGLTASTAYDWRVTGYNSNAASSQPDSETDPTNTATCTTDAPVSGPPEFNTATAGVYGSGTNTETTNHTIAATLTNGYIVAVLRQSALLAPTSITFDGVAMTAITTGYNVSGASCSIFGLAVGAKAAGTYALTANFVNGSSIHQIDVLEFENVHQSTPFTGVVAPAPAYASNLSLSVTSAVDDLAIIVASHQVGGLSSYTAGATLFNSNGTTAAVHTIGKLATTTSTALSVNVTTATNVNRVGFALKKA